MNENKSEGFENEESSNNFEGLATEDLVKITGGRIIVEAAKKSGGGGSGGASGAGGKKGKK